MVCAVRSRFACHDCQYQLQLLTPSLSYEARNAAPTTILPAVTFHACRLSRHCLSFVAVEPEHVAEEAVQRARLKNVHLANR